MYKPEAGERPLSDFEPGLYRRERAAHLLSESLAWGLVPPMVIREEAPLGVGSLQWFIECDFQEHYFTLYEEAPETHRELARMALFDYVAAVRVVHHGVAGQLPSEAKPKRRSKCTILPSGESMGKRPIIDDR